MAPDQPVVIIGAGLAGSATAWSLARRGVPVLVLEQFEPGHKSGSSHGSARIVRRAYGDALYVSLTGRAFELWRELEQASGATILRMHGGLDFGVGRRPRVIAGHLAAAGVPHEILPAAAAAQRWPGMMFEDEVVFHEQAGTMDAAGAVAAMLGQAARLGATVRPATAAASIDGNRVRLVDGDTVAARTVVAAVGGWLAPLAGDLVQLPPLRVTQQQVFHFPRRDPDQPPWPSVIHDRAGQAVYHLAGGRDGGLGDDRKLGEHGAGRVIDPDDRDAVIDPAARGRAVAYVERWLPGLVPTSRGEVTCLYTETATEDFLLDRVGDLVVCSPCSGHGAKFAPLIGELVADLVTGTGSASVPDRFRLAAHLSGRAGAVSL